jgi:transcriptional regulator with XRE-family HTH domain
MTSTAGPAFADRLKAWRARRHMSQLALALEANVSARHIAFLETGRSRPSRQMVLQLAAHLDLPLRARNEFLEAAGFVAEFREAGLDSAALQPIKAALAHMLTSHQPLPALLFDRHWNVVECNRAFGALLAALGAARNANLVAVMTSAPAVRAMILNWPEVMHEFANRLRLELRRRGGDPVLEQLLARAEAALAEHDAPRPVPAPYAAFVPIRLRIDGQILSLLSIIAEFGTPRDITVDDLRLELFFPADTATETFFRAQQ